MPITIGFTTAGRVSGFTPWPFQSAHPAIGTWCAVEADELRQAYGVLATTERGLGIREPRRAAATFLALAMRETANGFETGRNERKAGRRMPRLITGNSIPALPNAVRVSQSLSA
jgi:hypothetical protein